MKRKVQLRIIQRLMQFVIVMISCLAYSGSVIAQQNMYYVKSSSGLNLRSGASAGSKSILLIPAGDRLNVFNEDKDDWWEVEYNGKHGYVASEFLTKDPNDAAIARKIWDEEHEPPPQSTSSSAEDMEPAKHVTDYQWGIGVRAGDPTGVSVKKYFGSSALELTVGSLPFERRGLSAFVHYLFHLPAYKIGKWADIRGLDWYFGAGGQIKSIGGKVDFGVDGTVGAEYLFQSIPISVFADLIIYVELVDNPLNIDVDAGIGVRYNF